MNHRASERLQQQQQTLRQRGSSNQTTTTLTPPPKQTSPKSTNDVIPTYLRNRKPDLIAYSNKFIERVFKCDSSPSSSFKNPIALQPFLTNIMNRTRINTLTLITAFYYLDRLKQRHPNCKGSPGAGHRLFLAAILIASKYLYDDTFDNCAWATVSSGLFELQQVNHMEREMLGFLDYTLFINQHDWISFNNDLFHVILTDRQSQVKEKLECDQIDLQFRLNRMKRCKMDELEEPKIRKAWNSLDSSFKIRSVDSTRVPLHRNSTDSISRS
ncbi:hypothetical protein BC833DRAFT_596905 [Globomyces pollinis-pini]|nr:hypothetical protein BC833DRAFT_596905 [Globomyces pollinis-pini]